MAFKSVQYVQSTHAHLDVVKCCGCALSHSPAPVFEYSFPMTIVTFILWVKNFFCSIYSREMVDIWTILPHTYIIVNGKEWKKPIFDSKWFIVLIFDLRKIAPELKKKRKKCRSTPKKNTVESATQFKINIYELASIIWMLIDTDQVLNATSNWMILLYWNETMSK